MANLPRLDWLSRDARLLVLATSLRSFGQGFVTVTLAVYLADIGLRITQIGAFFTIGAAGVAFFAFAVGLVSERVGRKRLLVSLTLLASVSLIGLILTDNWIVLAFLAFVGALGGAQGGATGTVQPLIQACLAETATPQKRTDTFTFYRIVNTFARAFGALAAGLPTLLGGAVGLSETAAFKVVLGGLVVSLLLISALYGMVNVGSSATRRGGWTNPFKLPSRRTIFALTGLFSLDSFGGALVVQSLVSYWFYTKFGMDLAALSVVFFVSQLLTALSMWVAARLAGRIGLLNTMVFTHIPSSFFLVGVAFSPWAWLAVVFWQGRAFFSQMDVPTRDSYIMAIVGPEERVAMASMQQIGRSAANTGGPAVATAMWTALSASAPFVACAAIKIAYDLSLWVIFRDVRPPEEEAARLAERTPA